MTLASLGLGCLFASLTVVYRDFRYIVGFAMQIMMFLSPVIYPPDMLPKAYHPILSLNPMFGLIDGCRSAVLGTPWHLPSLAISSASSVVLFAFGLYYFRRTERRFAGPVELAASNQIRASFAGPRCQCIHGPAAEPA